MGGRGSAPAQDDWEFSVGVALARLTPLTIPAVRTLFTAASRIAFFFFLFFMVVAVHRAAPLTLNEWAGQGLRLHPLKAELNEEPAQDWMVWGPGGGV